MIDCSQCQSLTDQPKIKGFLLLQATFIFISKEKVPLKMINPMYSKVSEGFLRSVLVPPVGATVLTVQLKYTIIKYFT